MASTGRNAARFNGDTLNHRDAMRLNHSRAVLLMVGVTLMWSTAGLVSRHLEAARSFEVDRKSVV